MNGLLRAGLISAALSVSMISSAIAKPHNDMSDIAGTWTLNPTQSKSAAPALKSETRVYALDGNKVTMHADGIDASGKAVSNSYAAAYDGNSIPRSEIRSAIQLL